MGRRTPRALISEEMKITALDESSTSVEGTEANMRVATDREGLHVIFSSIHRQYNYFTP